MSSAGESDNIFDHASKMLGKGKKKKKPLAGEKTPTKPDAAPPSTPKSAAKSTPKATPDATEKVSKPREPVVPAEVGALNDEELDARVAKAKEMFDELQAKVDTVYDALGVSPSKAEAVLENPEIPPEVRKELDAVAQTLERDLFKGQFKEVRRRFSVTKQKKKGKRRRGKSIGGRKGWLPM